MHLAVLTGGWSSEREVAFWSAKNVMKALEGEGYDVVVFDVPSELPKFLEARASFACAVPVLHGKGGEDGMIQGFLKTLGVPFIFSDVAAHAVGMDKALTKAVVSVYGLKTPRAVRVRKQDRGNVTFTHPVVVKPLDGGSTVGTTIVRVVSELDHALDAGFEHSAILLVEDFIEGEEFTVPVIEERGEALALDVIQVVPTVEGGFYDFEAKYGSKTPAKHLLPAPISKELTVKLQEQAVTAHNAIGARHTSRSDFIVDREGAVWFLEINTIPGMTDASLLPEAIKASGRTLGGCLKGWIEGTI